MDTTSDILMLLSVSKKEVRLEMVKTLLALTGDRDGLNYLSSHDEFVTPLMKLLQEPLESSEKDSVLNCLINMATKEKLAETMLTKEDAVPIVESILKKIVDGNSSPLECMLLSNITHHEKCRKILYEKFLSGEMTIEELITSFITSKPYSDYDHLASVFANLTSISEVRRYLMDPKKKLITYLFPFTTCDSHTRRIEIARTLRNCCFDTEFHDFLLRTAEILTPLMLPLAGPEEFDEEDTEKLPLDLQYLDPSKERDPDPEIRKLLLEALNQLCATKSGREFIRDSGIYVMLRELHKWEPVDEVQLCCEDVVGIIIRDEDDISSDNLKEIEIPENVLQSFNRTDEQEQSKESS